MFSYLHAFFHSNKFASGQVNENALYQPFSQAASPSYRHLFFVSLGCPRTIISLQNRRYFFRLLQASAKQARGAEHVPQGKVPSSIAPVLCSTPALRFIHPKKVKIALVLLASLQELPLYCIHVFQQLISYHPSAPLQRYK